MRAALELVNVSFAYADAEGRLGADVLRDISLAVPRGQCVVLTGPSGCGKTTVMRLLNGLVPQVYAGDVRGRVLVGDRDAAQMPLHEIAAVIGSVFQNPRSQFFNLDTTSEVAFACENVGMPEAEVRRRVHRTAQELGMMHLMSRDIRALSGGQRQLVALASVYAPGPDVLLLDEPTAALDVSSMRLLAQVVKRCRALGRTVVVSEHRLWWLRGIADRVVHLDGGHVAHDWTAAQFETLPAKGRRALGLRAWRLEELDEGDGEGEGEGDGEGERSVASLADSPRAPRADPSRTALALDGVRAGYRRGGDVLRAASASFDAGAVTAVVGGNGSGKSTLARCVAGLHRERAGRVLLDGQATPCRRRAGRVYLVMQEPGYQLFGDTVEAELRAALRSACGREGGRRAPVPDEDERLADALARFGLGHLAARHPLSLSGGERQRLAIAAGVLQGARVMLLDEPTSGLDRRNMLRVACELRRARDAGVCVAVITHDYEFLRTVCTNVVRLRDGALEPISAQAGAGSAALVRSAMGFAS